ncbi:hypothetical protein GCM10022246_37870 [Pedobacter ginsengiterrae]|uniref:Uncharacterized protein n=1 Tax=Pedobacter ginsengiterrae TaxID=871696 RepID=A0ABP7QHQ2_9SPHI
MKILFDAATLNLRVMLRHEASATYETNASFIQMPEVKDCNEKRDYRNQKRTGFAFQKTTPNDFIAAHSEIFFILERLYD